MINKVFQLKIKAISGNIATVIVTLYLTACSTTSSKKAEVEVPAISYPGLSVYGLDGEPPTEVVTPWSSMVYLYRHDTIQKAGFIIVRARKTTQPDTLQQHIDYRLAQAPLDICHIITDGDGHSKARYKGSPWDTVNLGSNVTVNRPGSTPLTILPNLKFKYRINDLTGALPIGASLSLTTDNFPKVTAYNVSDTVAPENVTPDSGAWVNVDTKFTWKPSNDPSSYMEILFFSKGPNKWPAGHGLRCDVVDDGKFDLPNEALELVRQYENSLKVGYFRITRRMDYQDGVLFYQIATAVGDLSRL